MRKIHLNLHSIVILDCGIIIEQLRLSIIYGMDENPRRSNARLAAFYAIRGLAFHLCHVIIGNDSFDWIVCEILLNYFEMKPKWMPYESTTTVAIHAIEFILWNLTEEMLSFNWSIFHLVTRDDINCLLHISCIWNHTWKSHLHSKVYYKVIIYFVIKTTN